jgi:hypothetical protein
MRLNTRFQMRLNASSQPTTSRITSGTLLYCHFSSFLHSSHNCQNDTILVPLTIFVITAHICTMMMQFDHDKFLPPFVKLSTSPYCTNISSQHDGTHYNDNSQHGARYISTEHTPLPLPGKSQRTHLSTVNVHNDRLIGSAHFAQLMSHDSTYTSLSIAHVCSM